MSPIDIFGLFALAAVLILAGLVLALYSLARGGLAENEECR